MSTRVDVAAATGGQRRESGRYASRSLRHNRDFRLLWVGQAVSAPGSNIFITAYPLLVLALWMLGIAILATINRSIRHAPPLD